MGNALIGIVLFEWAMCKTRVVRRIDEERDSLFPAWRRLDVKKWSRWKMYPTAMTIMPIRLFWFLVSAIFVFILIKILLCRADLKSERSRRRKSVQILLGLCSYFTCIWFGVFPKKKVIQADYTEWLGPDYKTNQQMPKNVPTTIGNHSGPFDIAVILSALNGEVAFLAKGELENVPIVSYLILVMGGMFAPRGGTAQAKESVV